MKLIVNGKTMDLEGVVTVGQLLKQINPGASRIAILVNDIVVKAEKRKSHAIKDGDRIEILTFAGGG